MNLMTATPRSYVVQWQDLERWVIPSNRILRRLLPPGWTRIRIGNLVSQVTTRVKVDLESEYMMAGVKWYGEGVFHRETVRGSEMSASQVTPLVPGALIYNRLFAWKESFAVIPPEFHGYYVSNEFPQFVVDANRILPEYLYLFCTRQATTRAVNAASTGSSAVSRNRFKEDQFLNFEIPLPPLHEQDVIVNRWRSANDKISAARRRVQQRRAAIEFRFFQDLGLPHPGRFRCLKHLPFGGRRFRAGALDLINCAKPERISRKETSPLFRLALCLSLSNTARAKRPISMLTVYRSFGSVTSRSDRWTFRR
ncbi:MAG: restriction endonuclease subunit S [Edaphobacter sp.]